MTTRESVGTGADSEILEPLVTHQEIVDATAPLVTECAAIRIFHKPVEVRSFGRSRPEGGDFKFKARLGSIALSASEAENIGLYHFFPGLCQALRFATWAALAERFGEYRRDPEKLSASQILAILGVEDDRASGAFLGVGHHINRWLIQLESGDFQVKNPTSDLFAELPRLIGGLEALRLAPYVVSRLKVQLALRRLRDEFCLGTPESFGALLPNLMKELQSKVYQHRLGILERRIIAVKLLRALGDDISGEDYLKQLAVLLDELEIAGQAHLGVRGLERSLSVLRGLLDQSKTLAASYFWARLLCELQKLTRSLDT
ncbi:MAG: hypothetical protein V1821_02120 [bacterium]